MVLVIFVLFFVEAEREWVGSFVVSVEGVDEVLAPDSVTFGVIIEVSDAGDVSTPENLLRNSIHKSVTESMVEGFRGTSCSKGSTER